MASNVQSEDPSKIPWDVPRRPPPAGVTSNFDNPEDIQGGMIAAVAICTALVVIFVLMRLFIRLRYSNFGWDEATTMFALALTVLFNVAAVQQVKNGNGLHIYDIRLRTWMEGMYTRSFTWGWIGQWVNFAAMGMVKSSICLLYLRLMPPSLKKSRTTVYVILVAIVCYVAALTLTAIFACSPVTKKWRILNRGECAVDIWVKSIAYSSLNIASDFALLIAPLPMVWGLQLRTLQKLGIIALFAAGLIVTIFSILRIWLTSRLRTNAERADLTREQFRITLLCVIELNLALICSCMPACNQFLRRVVPMLKEGLGSRQSLGRAKSIGSGEPGIGDHELYNNGKSREDVHGTSVASDSQLRDVERQNA
ncbi:MAG: hypothetical protein M1837_006208 [Sclerophora amabilis]|nr:MAG: hypothetical protein M1837_006208 [Sclerophora amabilis]